MIAPCICWEQPASLHSEHCCMFDGTAVVPSCHPERASGRPACGCLSWLDRLDGRRCSHDAVTA